MFPISNRDVAGNVETPVITLLDTLFQDLRDKIQDKIQDTKPFYVECIRLCLIDPIKQS